MTHKYNRNSICDHNDSDNVTMVLYKNIFFIVFMLGAYFVCLCLLVSHFKYFLEADEVMWQHY